ncbi:citrate synthase [Zymoseptoria tritici IPO323]|uniref:Citrate synthase n=1 Tax=Zymoseptoria tritici (strain CBS 115943 / IPO323) TaxID=336722 RepID=F9X435_ZYMTI|nr:citrate synthase [Zymoseptoria tritici IPO323]EGP90157.1 citrate synthase [Zymoseptoria tritici IPO323]
MARQPESTVLKTWRAVAGLSTSVQRWKKRLDKSLAMAALALFRATGATSLGASSGTLSVTDNRTNRRYTIPIMHNSVRATDFRQIAAAGRGADPVDQVESGLRIIDRGFLNTACMESNITLIDGQRAYIQYRDHSIEHLFDNNDYEEVVHLLIWGHLPSTQEKTKLRKAFAAAATPPRPVVEVVQAFPRDALTGTILLAGLAAWAACDPGTQSVHQENRPKYLGNIAEVDAAIIRTTQAMATTIALAYCHKRGKPFTQPEREGTFIGNVLTMMGFTDNMGKPIAEIEATFARLWILYADHEMTNSTAAFLHAASTLSDPLSCAVSGIVSAYGPLHGGAIDQAYKGFQTIGTPENVPILIADVKAKKQRLFGYGHRIYKKTDPRAKLIRSMIDEHMPKVKDNPLLRVALEVDRVANEDDYFTSRNLKANADLYGCFLYTALGFETDIIVALASLSRTPGVMAHWRESMSQTPLLWRPLQVFTGSIASAARSDVKAL